MANFELTIDWDFIEKYLPNYHSSDQVLESDLLNKYNQGEEQEQSDIEYIEQTYEDPITAELDLNDELMIRAVNNFLETEFKKVSA